MTLLISVIVRRTLILEFYHVDSDLVISLASTQEGISEDWQWLNDNLFPILSEFIYTYYKHVCIQLLKRLSRKIIIFAQLR